MKLPFSYSFRILSYLFSIFQIICLHTLCFYSNITTFNSSTSSASSSSCSPTTQRKTFTFYVTANPKYYLISRAAVIVIKPKCNKPYKTLVVQEHKMRSIALILEMYAYGMVNGIFSPDWMQM